jgi:hypothetical protein
MAKRHLVSKATAWRGSTEAVRLQAEDAKARRPGSEDVDRSSALGTGPSIADGLRSRRDELFSQGNADQVYLVATIEGEQAAMGVTAAGRDTEDKKDGGRSTPAGTRLLIRSSPDRGSVLIHLDQHFIERGPYRSERERTLEIVGGGQIVSGLISHTCLGSINNSPGPYYPLSLLHTEPRARAGVEQTATFLSLDPGNQRGKDCLRGSQTICFL